MTADALREVVLALRDVTEGAHMGHADFRAGGRVFAGFTSDERRASLRLPPAEQAAMIAAAPAAFTPAAGAWGRQGWTMMDLASVDLTTARAAVLLAWEHTMANPARSRKKSSTRPRRS